MKKRQAFAVLRQHFVCHCTKTFKFNWLRRKSGPDPDSFLNVVKTALREKRAGQSNVGTDMARIAMIVSAAFLLIGVLDLVGAAPA